MTHLWTVDVTAATVAAPTKDKKPSSSSDAAAPPFGVPEAHRLTEGDGFSVQGFSWSKDGAKIAFAASKDGELKNGGPACVYGGSSGGKKGTRPGTRRGPAQEPPLSAAACKRACVAPHRA